MRETERDRGGIERWKEEKIEERKPERERESESKRCKEKKIADFGMIIFRVIGKRNRQTDRGRADSGFRI